MKPAVLAPLYIAIYPELAELFRKNGYALAIHGSLAKDFDLVAVPWRREVSSVEEVLRELQSEFGLKSVSSSVKDHGRLCHTVVAGCGTCYLDLSFVNIANV